MCMYLDYQQVTLKQVSKSAKKIMWSAMEAAKITWLKTQRKKNKAKLRSAEATLPELPEPPAGTSTARRLQDPDHIDIVKALVKVPSAQELGLGKKGEQLYDKMLTATTRGLNASTGAQYRRYNTRGKNLSTEEVLAKDSTSGTCTRTRTRTRICKITRTSGHIKCMGSTC